MVSKELMTEKSQATGQVPSKVKLFMELVKMRLTGLVVFSGCFGYLMAVDGGSFNWTALIGLMVGSFLITGAANTFNQIIEQEHDKLMRRTAGRPLPSQKLIPDEAFIFGMFTMLIGSTILLATTNAPTTFLSIVSLAAYAFVYTPLKRISPISVFVGAFPGAMPPLIGWVAGTGELSNLGWALFGIQFIWQFPHFWAIAWLGEKDYREAGFKMLPFKNGKSRSTAILTALTTVLILPAGIAPWLLSGTGTISAVICVLAGIGFLRMSLKLVNQISDQAAKRLMFASFIYLPVVQIALLLDKM
jgi:protoheme IX farnesyltransferase